jgi:hypothetical protein
LFDIIAQFCQTRFSFNLIGKIKSNLVNAANGLFVSQFGVFIIDDIGKVNLYPIQISW